MIIVISLGGSVLINSFDPERFRRYADAIREIAKDNHILVVTGGGRTARDYIGVAKGLGANESVCDLIGIDATRLNARLLIAALGDDAYPEPVRDYAIARNIYTSKIVVMGGMAPGQTTDAVSAVLAEYVNADLLINATAVDGVYTADPRKDKNATKYECLTPKQLLEIVMRTEMSAGANAPFDLLGAKIIDRSGIKAIVMNGKNPEDLVRAARDEHIGTVIKK